MWTEKEQFAFKFASNAHFGATRKSSDIPYITHPIEVADILKKEQSKNPLVSEDCICAAFLHDVVEDTKYSSEDIYFGFGLSIGLIVESNTEDKSKTWIERKTNTHIKILSSEIEEVYLLLADKLANIRGLREEKKSNEIIDWSKFNEGFELQKWYYVGILQISKFHLKDNFPDFGNELEECIEFVFN